MKTIIAGSRSITDPRELERTIDAVHWKMTEVVSGTARGVDRLGEAWARKYGVPIKKFPANWDANGRAAGHMRNYDMAIYADALIAIYDGKSRGTANMIEHAKRQRLEVVVNNCGVISRIGAENI